MTNFKPMLARDAVLAKLRFPLYVQPKLDGIRCSIVNGEARARSLKEIPNREIFEYLSRPEFEGLDGEILVGDPTADDAYNKTVSFVMSRSKTGADWKFYVFDLWNQGDADFRLRDSKLQLAVEYNFGEPTLAGDNQSRIAAVKSAEAFDMNDLEVFEQRAVDAGYEGVILRNPVWPYKFGRSAPTRGECLKLKRFVDGEAVIIGAEEKMHNANEARTNELGRTERSTAQAGLVPTGTLGALIVRDLETGVEFKIGTGFNESDRADLWHLHQKATMSSGMMPRPRGLMLIGNVVKYKSFPVGVKDRPRFPVFLGFRDLEIDG